MKKWQLSIFFFVAIFIAIGATTTNTTPITPRHGFKNLQVLPKDISKDDLDSIMDEYKVSLGVKCGFCHARKADTTQRGLDFASDAKDTKKIARSMMKMTAYINTNFFNFHNSTKPDTLHTIICYTCHRGTKQPDEKTVFAELSKAEQAQKKK